MNSSFITSRPDFQASLFSGSMPFWLHTSTSALTHSLQYCCLYKGSYMSGLAVADIEDLHECSRVKFIKRVEEKR